MKRALLLLIVCLGASWAAPVDQEVLEAASCADPVVLGAAAQAMDKINKDRKEGYVFSLRDLANAHMQKHGENGIVFYLTMNVLETNCHVLSKAHFKNCEVRDLTSTPVYGQCKVAIFISRVNRVVRLYKYNCVVRPVAAERVNRVCPDCPVLASMDNEGIKKAVSKTLEKFNKESGLSKHFALLQVTRATLGWGIGMMYFVQYTIQETTCPNTVEKPEDCPLMDCEFAHKGFCKGSHTPTPTGEEFVDVTCEIYEPEAAEREKKLHLLGGEIDHSHNDTHVTNPALGHDHVHDHTKGHQHHSATHIHGADDQHHHTHDHAHGPHRHAHDHSHDHGHGHDHVHAHHEKAHNHTSDHPNQHHKYEHAPGVNTHHHDHEMALDHDHKHLHLHEHEHHHHHHSHEHHNTSPHHHPEGMWRQIPPLSDAVTLPSFPDVPVGPPEMGVTLPLKPDPEIPGETEPVVRPFPATVSAECPLPAIVAENDIVGKLFLEDPEFKVAA
uniref:Fetuin B n=1 Tax=Neogobius melanostomus TaxID=47308 RepID=A0A8C6UKH5_9GOBI